MGISDSSSQRSTDEQELPRKPQPPVRPSDRRSSCNSHAKFVGIARCTLAVFAACKIHPTCDGPRHVRLMHRGRHVVASSRVLSSPSISSSDDLDMSANGRTSRVPLPCTACSKVDAIGSSIALYCRDRTEAQPNSSLVLTTSCKDSTTRVRAPQHHHASTSSLLRSKG